MAPTISYSVFVEVLGWSGALFFLVAYYLLITKRWKSDNVYYHLFNIAGGVLLTVNTIYFSAWSAAAINAIWAVIALLGLVRDRKQARNAKHS
ncbi:MAG TPA: hypothetical protein DCE41_09585 [Cytophagales bacterium]|nr:hypothetical protein [Cytophagales bacterium]HAA22768.1 hypothetical protein [Cytophagales bacterium]HAP62117.1 hypothetical protein [Cytophagales bacterium]